MKVYVASATLLAAALATTASAQVTGAPAAADPADVDASAVEEVVVTGTRVLDSPLQDEEGSGTSLKESVFRYSGSTRRFDVLRTVPGVTVLDLGNRSTIVVRGVATAPDGDPNGSAVQSYIGGVPLSGLGGSRENVDISNYDIERIDVLRGSLGYTFGGGAMSGVVRIVPRPADTGDYSGTVAASARTMEEGDEPGWEVDGFVNLPLVRDVLGLRLTGYANREESPYRSSVDGRQSSPGRVEGARASLRWEPRDTLTIDLRYVYDDRRFPDLSRSVIPLGDYVTSNFRETEGVKTRLAWLEAAWDLGFATVDYIGSRNDVSRNDDYFASFYTGAGGEQIEIRADEQVESITQELRLSNGDETGLDWVVGAYFERREADADNTFFEAGTSTPVAVLPFDPTVPNLLGDIRQDRQEQRSGYGELAYWFSPKFKLSGGTRYHWYKQNNQYTEKFEDGAPPTDTDPYPLIPSDGKWWWRGEATWRPQDGHLYYAQASQASRPGGANYGALPPSCAPEFAARVEQFYRGDTLRLYEAGAKLTNLGGRATMNASTYYGRWRDAPVYTAVPCGFDVSYLDNVKLMELYGVEFESTIRLSDQLSTTLIATYAETEIANIDDGFSGGEVGERTPGNPSWKLSAALDYVHPVRGGLDVFAGARVDYTGGYLNALAVDWSYYASFTDFPGLEGVAPIGTFPSGLVRYSDPGSGDYTLVNVRLGLRGDRWSASVFADNLFDDRTRTIVNYLDFTPNFEATVTRVTPRTLGVRVERSF